jgi:hypothetical protein
LDVLVAILKKYPAAKLAIAVHTTKAFSDMQNALRALGLLEAYLKSAAVPAGSYSLRWAGAQYPLTETDGPENMRMLAFFADPEALPFALDYQPIPSPVAGAVFFRNIMTKLFYQVSVPVPVAGVEAFLRNMAKQYPEGMLVQTPSGQLSFSIGTYLTYASARQWASDVAQSGYPDAAVTAWLRGWSISPEEAGHWAEEFPDLQNFIEK